MVKNAIKVYARLKPEKNRKTVVNYQVHHRPKENLEEDFLFLVAPTQKSKDYPDNRPESWNFSFFRIFEESTTQEDVFQSVAQPVVESALDGYNGTIFAYGQTASGKTYTITGGQESQECLGIIPRSLQYLFEVIRKRPENVYSVEVAYLEIYNESGYDLLDRRQREFAVTRLEDLPRVAIQEDEIGRLHLKNLTFHCVGSAEDAFELLLVGDHNRITAETPMNPQSSRSHCVFTIVISTKQLGADGYKRAKVHLVDLAGSERVYKCSISGTILTEAKHINLSLHYLEQVIVCLGQESAGHIPYRNSLLTSILRDSLGGNCLTTMLATLSIASYNLEETVSTCRFAQRVALIRNDVKLVLEKDFQSENALLRLENEKLRQQIKILTKDTKIDELTAEDKRNLDYQIQSFLESNEKISTDCNPKKIEYCFESFKRIFELNRNPNSCLKKLEYYKDMVIQRDKEISLLIDLIKKERGKKVKEGSIKDSLDDSLKLNEKSCSPETKFSEINLSTEKSNGESLLQGSTETSAKTLVSNVQDDKQDLVFANFLAKKQKTKSKTSRSIFQNHTNDNNRKKIDCDENVCADVDVTKTVNKKNSIEQFSSNRSISTYTSKPELLPCHIINLTVDDLIDSKNKEANEITQQTLRKIERKKAKCNKVETSRKKSIETKHDTETELQIKPDNDKNIKSPNIRRKFSSIEEAEVPLAEANDSIPFYQRFFSLNVPGSVQKLVQLTTDKSTKLTDQMQFQNQIKSVSNEQWNVPKLNFAESLQRKSYVDLNSQSDVSNTKFQSTDRSITDYSNADFSIRSRSTNARSRNGKRYDDTDDNFNSQRNTRSLGNEAKESNALSARSNACSFDDKTDSNRSKTIGRRTSISSFTTELPEKSSTFEEQPRNEKEAFIRMQESDENKHFESSLPLTGDTEIDEEIIAFYKAKRSGGIY